MCNKFSYQFMFISIVFIGIYYSKKNENENKNEISSKTYQNVGKYLYEQGLIESKKKIYKD